MEEGQRTQLLAANAQSNPKLFMGLKAVTENAKWVSIKGDKFEFSLRSMITACDQFYQSNINLYKYDYAKLLSQKDWSEVRITLEDLLAKFTIWTSHKGTSYSRPHGLSNFIDGAFKGKKRAATYWDALVLSLEDAASPADTLLAVDVALSRCWKNAKQAWRKVADYSDATGNAEQNDTRVPTFIVIDEAHNFAPGNTDDPMRKRVTQRLLQIASEGRKYGLYLILATQRPTKLHRELGSELINI